MKCTVAFIALSLVVLANLAFASSVWDKLIAKDKVNAKKASNDAPINEDLVKRIHSKTTLFKAKAYDKFKNLNKAELRRFLGTRVDPSILRRLKRAVDPTPEPTPPATFDTSTNWPNCKATFETIANQGNCAASWATATASAITDRLCVRYDTPKPRVSAWDLISCCDVCLQFGGNGCDGYSHPIYAAMHYIEVGIVTGGPYNGAACKPFPIAPDATDPITNTTCSKTCRPEYTRKSYPDDLLKGRWFSVRSNGTLIRNEIVNNGPAIATFEVYDDFYAYESGVYEHVEGDFVGVQSVRILGWGANSAGVKYWKVANSWGTDWGENGFFYIKRGVNECDIESYVVSPAVF